MKQKLTVVLVLLALTITACGMNPAEKLEEAAAEQIAETIIEQANGIDDVEINVEDGSASYTFEGDDGETLSVSSSSADENIDMLEGMGFTIDLPDGVGEGTVQQIEEDGDVSMVSGVFKVEGLTAQQFYDEMHATLTAAGFIYTDIMQSGKTQPDANDPLSSALIHYEHPDGVIFSLIWGDTDVILGMTKMDAPTESGDAGGETAVSPADVPATLDGSMNLDKTDYATGEAIVVTLIVNTPLADNAWVGIVPSETPHGSEAENDAVDVTYAYLRNAQDGIITLNAPNNAGNYDVRLFNTDSNGVELDSISIIVGG